MTIPNSAAGEDAALGCLLDFLRVQNYRFTTITPLTHAHILARRAGESAATLRDVFGWNLPFEARLLPAELMALLGEAGVVERTGSHWRSRVRVSTIGNVLFLHSAYPTEQDNAVFFGPDTYRFVRFVGHAMERAPLEPGMRILDIGCGSGAGGLITASQCEDVELILNDINPLALRYAAINAHAMGTRVELAEGSSLACVQGQFDLIIANPPYMVDHQARTYRHGGEGLGRSLSLRMATEALSRLAPGGRLMLYTGVAIVNGRDGLVQELGPLLDQAGCAWRYEEIDPDVFGEELLQPAYREVERIAAVGLVARLPI